MAVNENLFSHTRKQLKIGGAPVTYFSLKQLENDGLCRLSQLPVSIRILLENLIRNCDGKIITQNYIQNICQWGSKNDHNSEIPFMPTRVLMQDFTGVPAIVDMAAMRNAFKNLGGDPKKINPKIPVELIIDHSVQIDAYASKEAPDFNRQKEYERNKERYSFLRWGQQSFDNFNVVPPSTGICHQVNLEYLARVVFDQKDNHGTRMAFPDTVVGLDSHTTMINGLGVMGWGVGGIEAEAVMLGQPYYMLLPKVVGVKLLGELPEMCSASDLVLTITHILRTHGVVGKFVEFFGPAVSQLTLADRATIANMSPEYGATMGFFPVDDITLEYLRLTGRSETHIQLVENYCKEQALFYPHQTETPIYSETLEIDLGTVKQSLAGPKRPQECIALDDMKQAFEKTFHPGASDGLLKDGDVVIASITSCTNTSNPYVLMGAGLLAKKAVEKGLSVPKRVKTSLAPGSKVVTAYLEAAGLLPFFEQLNFHVAAYGCATCIGNSGPLSDEIVEDIEKNNLTVTSVISGNRNFEGRISPYTKANYLASPMLVVAYAIAGTVTIDFKTEPIGQDKDGTSVMLSDIWPSREEINAMLPFAEASMYKKGYQNVFDGDLVWQSLGASKSELYPWSEQSTYIKQPPFFETMTKNLAELANIENARVLVKLRNSVTTDHISPAGVIPKNSPAAHHLNQINVASTDYNSYGSRRGNHEIMMRGTFANVRLQNALVPGTEGGYTLHFPDKIPGSIYDSAMTYQESNTPLIVLAGKEYGTGSSRDWAAKGTTLLGIRAVIAESFERIHRSNLVGMGVLPLQFVHGDTCDSLGLTGEEIFHITGIQEGLTPSKLLKVRASSAQHSDITFSVIARLDSSVEVMYYQNGGILPFVLRKLLQH
ncbi:MAG: aconitate hydratase AcnA [Candidatus Magnetomorum sp.]|nr:aconitate hydratase AcnA [Candidatus Magnetomorum sp.]